MGFDECYQLGNVVKAHGLRGEVSIRLDTDQPEAYEGMESVFIDMDGKLVPFFVESMVVRNDRAITAFEGVEHVDEAKLLVGKKLYLPLSFLPSLPDGKYYYHDLVGCELFDEGQLIGKVQEVYEMPTNFLMSVINNGTEVLVPIEDEILVKVDIGAKRIDALLPEGLLDIYMNNDQSEDEA